MKSDMVPPWLRMAMVAALPLLSGCVMQYSAKSLGVPVVMMSEAVGQPAVGDSFNVTVHTTHFFWGLAPGKAPSLQQVLAGQLGDGAGVHDLTIRSHKTVTDVLFTGLTLGLISPSSVTFRGIVTRRAP